MGRYKPRDRKTFHPSAGRARERGSLPPSVKNLEEDKGKTTKKLPKEVHNRRKSFISSQKRRIAKKQTTLWGKKHEALRLWVSGKGTTSRAVGEIRPNHDLGNRSLVGRTKIRTLTSG